MIRGILLTISLILFAVAAGLAIWLGIKYFNNGAREISRIKERYNDKIENISRWADDRVEQRKQLKEEMDKEIERYKSSNTHSGKAGFLSSLIATLALFAFVITIPGSIHQVDTGTVAVVRHLGKVTGLRQPGTYFDFYMVNSYETYDTKVQQDKIVTAAYSKDGQTMELEVFLQYQVQSENIMKIATEYGSLDALQSRIETQTIEKTKAVMSSAEAMTIIQNRAIYSNNVSEAVRQGISGDYYVNVKDVVLTNIDFTDAFEASIENKVIAEQNQIAENTRAETEKQVAIKKAEAELEVAKLEAQKKIEEARGNAEAQKILAQATAEAATYKIIELAKTVGYDVAETYIYSVTTRDTEGNIVTVLEQEFATKQNETEDCVFLSTKYVIDVTSGPGAASFKTLVEDYLQYLAYLEQWDGKLPEVVAGDDAISIIVPNN